MPELVEPIARLKMAFEGIERLASGYGRSVRGLETALCHLQFAIDLLEDAKPAQA
jgi:hypothetical protein